MSDLDNFPLGRLGLDFLAEPEKGSDPESTVLTGGRPIGTALFSSLFLLMAKRCGVTVVPHYQYTLYSLAFFSRS